MPDITLCRNGLCPLRGHCYRWTAQPDPVHQSYALFEYDWPSRKTEPRCDYYLAEPERAAKGKPFEKQTPREQGKL